MYCTIIEKKMKSKPYRSHAYRKIEWKPFANDPLDGYWDRKDEVEREPREKWNIVLNESYRENGKVKKKQQHLCTVTYWDIVEGWYGEWIYERINKLYPEQYEYIDNLVYKKLQPIIDRVEAEYKKSEEYKVKKTNDKIKNTKEKEIQKEKEYQSKKYTYDSLFGKGYYDAHYDREGNSKAHSEEAKAWDTAYKKQEKQREDSYYNFNQWSNFETGYGIGLKDSESSIAHEVIVAGYKALAKKYHPDAGGSKEKFQELGNIKDKLLKLI